MVASGVSLPEVKEHLGHASLVTTEKYLHALRGGTSPVRVTSLEEWLEAVVFAAHLNVSWDAVGMDDVLPDTLVVSHTT
jgi:hypothetical protein